LAGFFVAACLLFLLAGSLLPFADFFAALGAAVILPGRFGFLAGDFLAFVARIFWDFEKPLLVALVIKLLISILEVENQLAFRLNPAHAPVYVCFISIIYRQVKKIPLTCMAGLTSPKDPRKVPLHRPRLSQPSTSNLEIGSANPSRGYSKDLAFSPIIPLITEELSQFLQLRRL